MVHTGTEHVQYTNHKLWAKFAKDVENCHFTLHPNPNDANMKAIYGYLRMKASRSEIDVNMFRTKTAIYSVWA